MDTRLPPVEPDGYLKSRAAVLLGALATASPGKAHRIVMDAIDRAYNDGFEDGVEASAGDPG